MNTENGRYWAVVGLAKRMAGDLAEFSEAHHHEGRENSSRDSDSGENVMAPGDALLEEYDKKVLDEDLRAATRSRFASRHYADAVESGVKALNECVRQRTGRAEDGDALMTVVFSPKDPLLRIGKGRSKSDESVQRGHMFLCQGVVGAWRNPRAHSNVVDAPERALMMLATINELIETTRSATRVRKRRKR